MILADTSAWIEHAVGRLPALGSALAEEQVLMHPWVLGELALGNWPDRRGFLSDCMDISAAPVVKEELVLKLIEEHKLFGSGLGWVDCQLLASAKAMEANLWTQDKALKRAWERIVRA